MDKSSSGTSGTDRTVMKVKTRFTDCEITIVDGALAVVVGVVIVTTETSENGGSGGGGGGRRG